jgi:hypothetical protein
MDIRRLFPPPTASSTTTVANGTAYESGSGRFLEVADCDAQVLAENGWTLIAGLDVGSTDMRPTGADLDRGRPYLDRDIGRVIVWDGRFWRDLLTAATV